MQSTTDAGVLVYVQGAKRMMTAACLREDGLYVRFADEAEATIPLTDIGVGGRPRSVDVPRPYLVQVHCADGGVEEVPWDFARYYADRTQRNVAEEAATRGRAALATRVRELRRERGISQQALADRARITRVSVARIEAGEQSPRYRTLLSLAEALEVPLRSLLAT